jgi:hypothetical protein
MKPIIASLLLCLLCTFSCKKNDPVPPVDPPILNPNSEIARTWAATTLFTVRYSFFNTPTYTSRSLGYMGLAMYESIINGDSSYASMGSQLNGLVLPMPQAGMKYQWELSLNAAQQTMLKYLYLNPGNANDLVYDTINATAERILNQYSPGVSQETIDRSIQFGKAVADAIYAWSRTDGGELAYTRNFDPSFVFPAGDSYWIPPIRGQSTSRFPLHPYWGSNRTFVKANSSLAVPPITTFSTVPGSAYYKLYKDVYDKDKVLTKEEREIAAWWGDDPSESVSPPGHSYYLVGLAIKNSNAGLMKAAEAYAKTGMAVADAFINCWKVKTTYFNERPGSYVVKYIDPTWRQFWPEPPFPAFSSGHATQSGAVATVLTDVFGSFLPITDDLHVGNRRIDDPRFLDLTYPARSFNSFWDAANECAYSRFLGGIHTKQDNDIGLAQGTIIGQNVNALKWKK